MYFWSLFFMRGRHTHTHTHTEREMILRAWTVARLVRFGALFGVIAGGYYTGVHVPHLRQQCKPLPPKRQTALFVAGGEVMTHSLPDTMSKPRFFLLVVYRLCILFRCVLPIIVQLVLALARGEIVLTLRPNATKVAKGGAIKSSETSKGLQSGSVVKEVHQSTDGTEEILVSDAEKSKELEKRLEKAAATTFCGEDGIESIVSWRLPSNSSLYDMVLRLLKSMGPAYIKMGQWAASRPDIFPESLITKLSELFDSAPAHPWEYTQRELQRHGLLEHLENIEEKPLNSGSAGQVHRATLKTSQHIEPERVSQPRVNDGSRDVPLAFWWVHLVDRALRTLGLDPTRGVPTDVADLPRGTPVVVKILHPNVQELILADVCIIRFAAWAASKLPGAQYLSLEQSADEIAVLLLSQLDLRRECDNLLVFRHNFIGSPHVKFPVPVPQLSFGNILVESFEKGSPILNVEPEPKIAEISFQAFCKMMLEDNFIHADLHPGNLLIRYRRPDGSASAPELKAKMNAHEGNMKKVPNIRSAPPSALKTWVALTKGFLSAFVPKCVLCSILRMSTVEVVFLDPGLVTTLSAKERSNFVALFTAIAIGDGRLAGRLMLERAPFSLCIEKEKFFDEMQELFDVLLPKKGGLPSFCFETIQFGATLAKAFDTMRRHKVRVEGAFATLIASVVVGEGLGRMMNPDFNILGASVPFLLRYLQQHEMKELYSVLTKTYMGRS